MYFSKLSNMYKKRYQLDDPLLRVRVCRWEQRIRLVKLYGTGIGNRVNGIGNKYNRTVVSAPRRAQLY